MNYVNYFKNIAISKYIFGKKKINSYTLFIEQL